MGEWAERVTGGLTRNAAVAMPMPSAIVEAMRFANERESEYGEIKVLDRSGSDQLLDGWMRWTLKEISGASRFGKDCQARGQNINLGVQLEGVMPGIPSPKLCLGMGL